jgi:hypothetical protein
VETSGYFDDAVAAGFLEQGSILYVSGDLDGTPWHNSYVIASNDGTTLTLASHASVPPDKVYVKLSPVSNKAADAAVTRVVAPVGGKITKIWTVLNAALATGDATLTGKINGSNITTGVLTVTQSGSAAADVDSAVPTALNTVAAGDVISFTGGGASTATSTSEILVEITPS